MIDDERMADQLRTFYEEQPVVRPDRIRMTRNVADEIRGKPQGRRSRWWLPPFKRTPAPSPAVPGTEFEPTPIPATNGRTPMVSGRTLSMFSPAKAITAGAIVFAIGGVLLIAQPFDQQGASTPGAATDDASVAISRFTVLEADNDGWFGPVSETDEGLLLEEGSVQFGGIHTTDPRISGETVITYNGFLIDEETGTGENGVYVGRVIITNAGGRWIGTDMDSGVTVLEGIDGYAGLTAVLGPEDGQGVIFPGDMPPTPKDWCQLAREDFAAATSRIRDDWEIGWVKDRTSRLCPSLEMP